MTASPSILANATATATYDLVIVGGGIVGLTVACFFHDQNLRVAIIERESQSQAANKNQAYALHLSSKQVFEQLGLWDTLEPKLQAFTQVQLSDAHYPCVVQYQAKDIQSQTVGYVATHQALLQELQTHINSAKNITYLCPYTLQAISTTDAYTLVTLTDDHDNSLAVQTRLVIAADGSQSPLRQQAGIQQQGWAYPQNCLVATLAFDQPQPATAYERFWPTGPLGVLPLSPYQYRIVWTLPTAQAQQTLAMSDPEFIQALQPQLDPGMGKFRIVGQRFQFPTKLRQSRTYIKPRLALVGDAAHSCHPVGGQGLNLGIRDAAALATVIRQAQQNQEDFGSSQVLRRYQHWRLWQNWLTLAFTDVLNRLFSNQAGGIVQLRRLILHLLKQSRLLRYLSLRFMAGLWG